MKAGRRVLCVDTSTCVGKTVFTFLRAIADDRAERNSFTCADKRAALRPFRVPHHTISDIALVGGGTYSKPSHVSVAHHGVLFLNELLQFERKTLEVLRQPMENGCVTISRAKMSVTYPAQFILVCALNA